MSQFLAIVNNLTGCKEESGMRVGDCRRAEGSGDLEELFVSVSCPFVADMSPIVSPVMLSFCADPPLFSGGSDTPRRCKCCKDLPQLGCVGRIRGSAGLSR